MKTNQGMPLITVITVVFNDKKHLEDTLLSVTNQTYEFIEYIVIDGGSTDGTVELIKQYESQISYWVSEPDNGIYDAMNKGIERAKGDWINFMNSGDMFFDENIISQIAPHLKIDSFVVSGYLDLYYKSKFVARYGNQTTKPHQACFFQTQVMKTLKFNLDYTILADGELLQRLQKLPNYQSKYVDMKLAKFYFGGIGNHPKYLMNRLLEEKKLKSSLAVVAMLKWRLFQAINIIGWLYYKAFGIESYYVNYQKMVLCAINKTK